MYCFRPLNPYIYRPLKPLGKWFALSVLSDISFDSNLIPPVRQAAVGIEDGRVRGSQMTTDFATVSRPAYWSRLNSQNHWYMRSMEGTWVQVMLATI